MKRRAFLRAGLGASLAAAGAVGNRRADADSPLPYRLRAPVLAADADTLHPAVPEPTLLKGWADLLGVRIGGPVIAGNPKFRDTISAEFNLANIYGGWNEPTRGEPKYFAMNDAALARRLGLPTFFISILDPSQVPAWIRNGNFSKTELKAIVKARVEGMMAAGTGLIDEWVVVSEPNKPQANPNDFFWKTIGPDYVDYAYEVARNFATRNNITAPLLYMDFGGLSDTGPASERLQQCLTISRRLKHNGLLDKVAVEGDLLYGWSPLPTKESITRALKLYEMPVVMNEVAVMMHAVPGTKGERFAKQAEVYGMLLSAAIDSGVCNEFIVPAAVDSISYWDTQPPPTGYPDNDATPFDDDMSRKPAYYAMQDVLKSTAIARGLFVPVP